MSRVNYIDKELMEKMCHPIAVAIFDTPEDPIAKFGEHEISLLESALNNPRHAYGGKELYPTLAKKAAILYYGLNKNHPYKNGNKRIATASFLVLLYINDHWLSGHEKEIKDYLVELAVKVANSNPNEKDAILEEFENWIEAHIIYQEH